MKKVFLLTMILVLVFLSACGGSTPTKNILVIAPEYIAAEIFPTQITTEFRGERVTNIPEGFCIKNCVYPGNPVLVSIDANGNIRYSRVFHGISKKSYFIGGQHYQIANIQDMAKGMKIQMSVLGLDPNLIVLEGNKITVPDFGLDLEVYTSIYGTPERLQFAKVQLKELLLKSYQEGAAFLDFLGGNFTVDPRSGRIVFSDFEFVVLKDPITGYPDTYPVRSLEEYSSALDKYLGEEFDTLLNSGTMPVRPYDSPEGFLLPTPVLSQVRDYPTSISELYDGVWFRGYKLRTNPLIPNFFIMKRGEMNSYVGQTWVTVNELGEVYFAKVVSGTSYANELKKAWEINLVINNIDPLKVSTQVIDAASDLHIVITPDVGLGWDYFWGTNSYNDVAYKQGASDLLTQYEKLYDHGVAIRVDVGVHQGTICNSRVMVCDFDGLILADADGKFPIGSGVEDRDLYLRNVRNAIQSDFTGGPLMLATPIAAILQQSDDIVPNGTTVRLYSPIDGQIYLRDFTPDELVVLRNGGDEAISLLSKKGMPLPQYSSAVKGVITLGKGAIIFADFVGVAWFAWEVSETMNDVAGFGPTYQIDASGDLVPIDNNNPDVLEDLSIIMENGFENSVAMRVFKSDLNTFYASAINNSVLPVGCINPRLEDTWEQSFPGMPDADSYTPISGCANPSQLIFSNAQTGIVSIWDKSGASWTLTSGPVCHEFITQVFNGNDKIMVVPFNMCVDSVTGVITYTPTWGTR